MHVHILGICGTFMAGLAILAKESGHRVTGSDLHVYPPMSTMLSDQGIDIITGYEVDSVPVQPDCYIIGNAMKRGMPVVEQVLNGFIPFTSGPQWLSENILSNIWVLAVTGTHGKTTTSSMLAWIMEYAGLKPGFLIGGLPNNFGVSARLGETPFFVIEADEYDSAFFDKRSKFVHYKPRTLILNNCEFDHADIFDDLAAIRRQFHHLIRTVPDSGLLVVNGEDQALAQTIQMGCWTPITYFSGEGAWQAHPLQADASVFEVFHQGRMMGVVSGSLFGHHNMQNALAAIAAAYHVGVLVPVALEALSAFQGIRRRMEIRGCVKGVTVYDDFAHHPTAITKTLEGLRNKIGSHRLIAVLECGSYTMRHGIHRETLSNSLIEADLLFCKKPHDTDWSLESLLAGHPKSHRHYKDDCAMIKDISHEAQPGDHVVVMSNTGFGGFHDKLLLSLEGESHA